MSSVVLSMQDSGPFKQAFLKNLLLGLKKGGVASRDMSFHERKNAIKLAADVALASTRGGAPCWSRALAAELEHRGGQDASPPPLKWKSIKMSKKILRRNLRRPKPRKAAKTYSSTNVGASVLARARVLKEIIPGGKGLDECTLLGETLDYAMSLKAQVDVMQLLVRAFQVPKPYACSTEGS